MSTAEIAMITQELRSVKQELLSLRKIVKQILPAMTTEPKAEWVDIKIAAERCGLTVRQMRYRLQNHEEMARVMPKVGTQVNMTAFNNYYNR